MTSRPKHGEATLKAKYRDLLHQFAKDNRVTMRTEALGARLLFEEIDNGNNPEATLELCCNFMKNRKSND